MLMSNARPFVCWLAFGSQLEHFQFARLRRDTPGEASASAGAADLEPLETDGLKNVLPFCTARIARDRSCEEVCLTRKPTAPDAIACSTYASSLCAGRTSTSAPGRDWRICRVASNPLSSGIAMSIRTMSGKVSWSIPPLGGRSALRRPPRDRLRPPSNSESPRGRPCDLRPAGQ